MLILLLGLSALLLVCGEQVKRGVQNCEKERAPLTWYLVKQVNKLQNEVEDLNAQVSRLKSGNKVSNGKGEDVAFQVTQTSRTSKSKWTTLKFDTVKYNAGNGYDATSGIFTAPGPGTYVFWATVQFDSHTNNYVYIYKGNQKLAAAFTRPSTGIDARTVSVTAATFLAKGGKVHFRADVYGSGSPSGKIHGYGLSSYGGALVHAI